MIKNVLISVLVALAKIPDIYRQLPDYLSHVLVFLPKRAKSNEQQAKINEQQAKRNYQ